jgi:hypothetical protein
VQREQEIKENNINTATRLQSIAVPVRFVAMAHATVGHWF